MEWHEIPSANPPPSPGLQGVSLLVQLTVGRLASEPEPLRLRGQRLAFEEIAACIDLARRMIRRLIDEARRRMEGRQWR